MRLILFFLLVLSLCGCQDSLRQQELNRWMQEKEKIRVLSTIAMIDDLVSIIGGDKVNTYVLISGQLDPHSYQLVKGDDEKISAAEIIFFNGLNLEHGPSLKKTLYGKHNAIGLGDEIYREEPEKILKWNGQIDPHIWMDVSLWSDTIPHIVSALSRYDPENKDFYQENGMKLKSELLKLHQNIYNRLQDIEPEKRYLVTSHDAFNYFAKAYLATEDELKSNTWQKRFQAPEGLAPDSQLSAIDIQNVVDHLQKHHIQVIFPESNVSQDSIRKIVSAGNEKGLDVTIAKCPLYADAMGSQGSQGDTYMKMVDYNAKLIGLYLQHFNPILIQDCE